MFKSYVTTIMTFQFKFILYHSIAFKITYVILNITN